VDGQADLLEVVLALEPCRGLADLLHRGHQEGDQDRDDGDDHEEFDQRESAPLHEGVPGEGQAFRLGCGGDWTGPTTK
jgi:hypothetical protein